jgi:hypothetical protein
LNQYGINPHQSGSSDIRRLCALISRILVAQSLRPFALDQARHPRHSNPRFCPLQAFGCRPPNRAASAGQKKTGVENMLRLAFWY